MRKNLFLTLALIVASIATVNAQWSQVLSTVDGLPGITDKTTNCMVVETGLITPDAPISGLRFTVIETRNMESPDGHPCTAFAEFMIRDAEGNAINYSANGNSYIAESTGWPALNDGLYDGYMHTNWSSSSPTGAHHYIEFTFNEPVSSFSLLWHNRQGNPKNAPTLVVLTEKGVDGEAVEIPEIPTSSYTLGSQITSLEELLAAGYVSMEAQLFKGDWSTDVTGWLGNRFYTASNAHVISDSTHLYNAGMAMQIVPAETEGEYYLYWPETNRYFGNNNLSNSLAQNEGCHFIENGSGATNTAQAASITFTENGDGTFTMSFMALSDELAYICADPRTEKFLKSVNELFKTQNEAEDYATGFGYPCCFNFKFYSAEYEKAPHMIVNELKQPISDVKYLNELFKGAQASEDYLVSDGPEGFTTYAQMMDNLIKAEAIIESGEANAVEASTLVSELQKNQIWYLYSVLNQKIDDAYIYYEEIESAGRFCEASNPTNGCFTYDSWANLVNSLIDSWYTGILTDIDYNGPLYSYYDTFISAFSALEQAITAFNASEISFSELPLSYSNADGLPGTVSDIDTRVWTSPGIRFQDVIEKFRITFVRSENPNGGVVGSQDRAVVLGELIIMDADGNRITGMTGDMVQTNAIEPNEGSLNGLFDGTFDASGNLTSSIGDFYHSPWSDANGWDSNEYIYFDITLPQAMSGIKITFHSRVGNKSFNPADICIGEYGVEYDPIASSPNTYNAEVGTQITDASEIEDWGVYAIQGLINTNPNTDVVAETAQPNWYAGEQPYHSSVVREECAYFFTKNADGSFKIMSIGESKYWTAGGGLSAISTEAGNVKIAASTNEDFAGQNTLVLYTEVENPEPTTASLEYANEETEVEIIVEEVEVTCPYNVLMDWGPGYGLASRTCIDIQPGVTPSNYGEQAENVELLLENPSLLASGSAGDYLHFNKTSGEGEWKIYRLSLDNPFYYWSTILATVADGLGFIAGNNPGEYTDLGSYAADVAAVQAVVENNDYAGAEAAAKKLAATIENLSSGEVTKNPIVAGIYAILGDARGAHALTVDNSERLVATTAPTDYTGEIGAACLFELAVPSNIDDLVTDEYITEEQKDKVFTIKHVNTELFLVGGDGTSVDISLADDKDQAGAFLFTGGATNYFTIGKVNNYDGYNQLHIAGGLNVVSWNGEPTSTSASGFRLVRVSNDETSIDNLVAEGSEVASVKYYTAGGAESATPVKGLNIVTIVYTNGVTETKKVVVE